MADNKLSTRPEAANRAPARAWYPFESFRQEVDRLFEDFGTGLFRSPFDRPWPASFGLMKANDLAVDIAEKDGGYEVTAELPGIDEKDIEVFVKDGRLSITAQKNEEKKEEKKDYVLSERRYGAFERHFGIPDGIDAEKISAAFKKGVLTVTLPKAPEAREQEKKITVKAT